VVLPSCAWLSSAAPMQAVIASGTAPAHQAIVIEDAISFPDLRCPQHCIFFLERGAREKSFIAPA